MGELMAASPPHELPIDSAPWGEKLEELQFAIRECYGFDQKRLPDEKLVRLFGELDVEGVGRVAVDWLVSLFQPKSAVASAVRRGSITRNELCDLIISAQEEEVNRLRSPLSIIVVRVRDNVTLVSYSALKNGLMNLELQTALRKLMVDVVNGNLTGSALRNISVGVCFLDCAMDRQKKFLALMVSSHSDDRAEPRRRCLQELLEATRACNRSDICSSGGLAEELGPTLEAHIRRLKGAGLTAPTNTRRDSIVEHLNITAKSLSGRRVLMPDELKLRTSDCDEDVLSVGTDTSVVDDNVESDAPSSGEEPCPVRKRNNSFYEARDALDLGDPKSWKQKHASRKSLWLSAAPRDGNETSTLHERILDEGRRSHDSPYPEAIRKSVSFTEAKESSDAGDCSDNLPSANRYGYRASYIEAREALNLGDPKSFVENYAQRKSLWLSDEPLETVPESPEGADSGESPTGSPNYYRESFNAAREGLHIGDAATWNEKYSQRKSLWLSVKGPSEGA